MDVGHGQREVVDDVAATVIGAGAGRIVAVSDVGPIKAVDRELTVGTGDDDRGDTRIGEGGRRDHGATDGDRLQTIRCGNGKGARDGTVFRHT
ncbi:MAG: hypothetical protein OQL27_01265, partial [Sedimenticola sp.]|nr:hypothetical protein [Sedimenticola sp.]